MDKIKPPRLAMMLLSLILPKRIHNNLIGDLLEEYEQMSEGDHKAAKSWFWRQVLETNFIYLSSLLSRPTVLYKLNILIPLGLFFLATLLISWLSSMNSLEGYSEGMWQRILEGKVHLALFESAFWQDLQQFFPSLSDFNMYIDLPSVLFTTVNLIVLYKMDKKLDFSALRMAVWGYGLMLVPYVWALIHINTQHLEPKQIGPVIAFGLITFFYMILPVSYMVNKKLKKQIEQDLLS